MRTSPFLRFFSTAPIRHKSETSQNDDMMKSFPPLEKELSIHQNKLYNLAFACLTKEIMENICDFSTDISTQKSMDGRAQIVSRCCILNNESILNSHEMLSQTWRLLSVCQCKITTAF